MQYKTGSYIMKTRQVWKCKSCEKDILTGVKCFTKVKEYGKTFFNKDGEKYRYKTYTRWHIECAKQIDNLNNYEKKILGIYQSINQNEPKEQYYKYHSSEKHLRMVVYKRLLELEEKNKLTFLGNDIGLYKDIEQENIYKVGRKGTSDLTLFLPNQKVIFLELKTVKFPYLNKNQKEFKTKIENLNYPYCIIHTLNELNILLKQYNIL